MTPYLKVFPVVLIAVAILDFIWLGIVMKDFYGANLGHLMGSEVVWPAAILFYLIFTAGLILFAVVPGIAAGSLLRTALLGATLGLIAYSTYDLSNQATLKDWPLAVTLADIAWGIVISTIGASVGYLTGKFFRT